MADDGDEGGYAFKPPNAKLAFGRGQSSDDHSVHHGWDIWAHPDGGWRGAVISPDGDYHESEFFDSRRQAVAHAKKNPRQDVVARINPFRRPEGDGT